MSFEASEMRLRNTRRAKSFLAALVLVLLSAGSISVRANEAPKDSSESGQKWVPTWASAQQTAAPSDLPSIKFNNVTVRQIVHVSAGGKRLRVRLSNLFGDAPVEISGATVALSDGGSSIKTSTSKQLKFGGKDGVTIPAGAVSASDPLDFKLPELANVAITIHVVNGPNLITSHPGSRTTSYLLAGNELSVADFKDPIKIDRWYFITGLEIKPKHDARAVAILGDSITDGRGTTTNGNDRWPDQLSKRLRADKKTKDIAVLNMGIGGNRLLRDGLGPSAVSRLERDVLQQAGVRWLIVLEGVNDIGTRLSAKKKGETWASAEDIIDGYKQIVARAHAQGIKVYGATITPFGGSFYAEPDTVEDRNKINNWILTSGAFDGVIDLAKATCDPARPDYLLAAYDSGDHLHLNPAGYAAMGEAVDLSLFGGKNAPSAAK